MSQAFVSGVGAVLARIKTVEEARIKLAANSARTRIVLNLSQAGTGTVYKIPGFNRHYTASRPGEYPVSLKRTGELAGSIRWKFRRGALVTDAIIGTDKEYGKHLEKKQGAGGRPWLERSLTEEKPTTKQILGRRWF